jgi:hypothetical protein
MTGMFTCWFRFQFFPEELNFLLELCEVGSVFGCMFHFLDLVLALFNEKFLDHVEHHYLIILEVGPDTLDMLHQVLDLLVLDDEDFLVVLF